MFNIFSPCSSDARVCLLEEYFLSAVDLDNVVRRIRRFSRPTPAHLGNAKKIVEVELKMKGTPLHAATVVGDTVGDPFKDTSSVAMNPIIKFTTLFGLLAVELAVSMRATQGPFLGHVLAAVFFALSTVFVWRSFYGMRIGSGA
jgi:hypothetical protein